MRGTFAQYDAKGASALMDSVRAALLIAPTTAPHFFKLVAGKRGDALRWMDEDGNLTNEIDIAHSCGYTYWRRPSPEEVAIEMARAKESTGRKAAVDTSNDAAQLAAALRALPKAVSTTEMWDKVIKKLFTNHHRQENARDRIKKDPSAFGVTHYAAKNENGRMVEYWGGPTQLPIPDPVGKADGDGDADADDGERGPW